MDRKLAIWDLDMTLGSFDDIYDEFTHSSKPSYCVEQGLKPNIEKLLAKMQKQGFVHVVACDRPVETGTTTEYAQLVLGRTGLDKYIERVFGDEIVEDIRAGTRKNYWLVTEAMSIPDEKIQDSVIIMGDNQNNDRPIDPTRPLPVFVNDSPSRYHDSYVVGIILKKLLGQGGGSFKDGFDALYSMAQGTIDRRAFIGKTLNLRDIEFEIGFRANMDDLVYNDGDPLTVPVIQRINAQKYYKDVPFIV